MHAGTVATPSNLDELFQEYKQFQLLKKKDDMNTNMEAGSNAYLVARSWMKKYSDWILYDEFRTEKPANQLRVPDNHFEANFAGPIISDELLELD